MWIIEILEALIETIFRRKTEKYEEKFKTKRTPRGKRVH